MSCRKVRIEVYGSLLNLAHKYNTTILTTLEWFTAYYFAQDVDCVCQNGHEFELDKYEAIKRDANGFMCYDCDVKCIRCKEQHKIRPHFIKSIHKSTLYKICGECRKNMSTRRETNRIEKLKTEAESPFPYMDTDVILYIMSLVKHKNSCKRNPLMMYRQVCTRFNECIYGYASHELDNPNVTRNETLLYLSKIGVEITNYYDFDRKYKIPAVYKRMFNPIYHSEALKLSLKIYGSYENMTTKLLSDLFVKFLEEFAEKGMPCMFKVDKT